MRSETYPGKGLSLPQLVFALNVELNSITHSSLLSLDQLSQVAKDISTASVVIHELRNSLVPVNLLPLDVLLLIPTHLASLDDRLRATFVCRRWRRAFVQHAPIWSQLTLTGATDRSLLTTLLERAKQSPLDVTLHDTGPLIRVVKLLSSFTQQIMSIDINHIWEGGIEGLSMAITGPLPLLRTLNVEDNGAPFISAQTSPLFEGAVNLKTFVFSTYRSSWLSRFAFPSLTTFHFFFSGDDWDELPVSLLLDFLEASPSLQEINLIIAGNMSWEDLLLDRVLVLPHVKDFCLTFRDNGFSWELATYISCPSAKRVGFGAEPDYGDYIIKDIYPTSPLPWCAITRQYTTGTIDRVEVQLKMDEKSARFTCSIVFRSSNETTLELFYKHPIGSGNARDQILDDEIGSGVFSRASSTIRDHPLLENVRHLCIYNGGLLAGDLDIAANDVGKLLGSMGPLKKLDLHFCDLRPYLDPFLETPLFPDAIQPTSFPSIEELRISNPIQSLSDNEAYATALVKLVKSQHARGTPVEHVTLQPPVPPWVVEELRLSVNTVEVMSNGSEGQN